MARPSASHRPSGEARQRHDEAAPVAAQRIDRMLHALRRLRLEPGAEGKYALVARCRAAMIVVSPKISGWSSAAVQATSTCGSDSSSALSRSISAVSVIAWSRAALSIRSAWLRVRNSTMVASAAKQTRPKRQRQPGDVLTAGCCQRADQVKSASAAARAGAVSAIKVRAAATGGEEAAPPRTRTQPLVRRPDRLRHYWHAPGMRTSVRHAVRESQDFTPGRNSGRKSPDRERDTPGSLGLLAPRNDENYFSASAERAMSSTLMRASAAEKARSAAASAGRTTSAQQRRRRQGWIALLIGVACGAHDVLGRYAPALAGEHVAAVRPADPFENAVAH